MLTQALAEVSAADILGLISNGASESRVLEFKSALRVGNDSDRKEFLADVSSFANSSGGDLLYGIRESCGIADEVTGISCSDPDLEIRRLDDMISSGIEPRIHHACKIVDVGKQQVLIIRIEKSWNSPHRVVFKGHDKFYGRNSAGKYPLDVGELRDAFNSGPQMSRLLKNFRLDRVSAVSNDEADIPLVPGSKLILHLLPFDAFMQNRTYDTIWLLDDHQYFQPINSYRNGSRMTLDGVLGYSSYKGPVDSYVHVYRTGQIEAVETSLLNHIDPQKVRYIPSTALEQALLDSLPKYLSILSRLGISGPIALAISMTETSGLTLATGYSFPFQQAILRRREILLPETILTNLNTLPSVALRSSFDLIWNAFGFRKSTNFDQNGNWSPRN